VSSDRPCQRPGTRGTQAPEATPPWGGQIPIDGRQTERHLQEGTSTGRLHNPPISFLVDDDFVTGQFELRGMRKARLRSMRTSRTWHSPFTRTVPVSCGVCRSNCERHGRHFQEFDLPLG
jgi:hypothetical protein